jgi:hypothetical protein
MRNYELFKQYQNPKTLKGFLKITVDGYREFIGIKKDTFVLYGHLKDMVILRCQRELLKKTDITFNIAKEVKEGRKIVALEFEILPNLKKIKDKSIEGISPKLNIEVQNKRERYLKILSRLEEKPFLISKKDLEIILNLCITNSVLDEDLENSILAVQENLESGKKIIVMAQLRMAIKEGWTPTKPIAKRKQEDKRDKISSLKLEIHNLIERKTQTIGDFEDYLVYKAKQIFKKLPEEEQEKEKNPHRDRLKETIKNTGIKKETFDNMLDSFAKESVIKDIKKEHFEKDRNNLLSEYLKSKDISFEDIDKKIKALEKELKTLEKEQA